MTIITTQKNIVTHLWQGSLPSLILAKSRTYFIYKEVRQYFNLDTNIRLNFIKIKKVISNNIFIMLIKLLNLAEKQNFLNIF